ncbi:MAG: HD domain-containing protein [Deltaproteobacteria bacterium]|nr:HD domain-containing protein [Deltaproteobacteria bacterium]
MTQPWENTKIRALLERLCTLENESYLVGGAIRDALMGRPPRLEIDVAARGDGYEIARTVADHTEGGRFVGLDKERGAGRIVLVHEDYASVDVSSFKGESILEDLTLRDFTINALAVKLEDLFGEGLPSIIDPTCGATDLRSGTIRACSARAFDDDPVRILRAFRFSAQLGFAIDPATIELIPLRLPGLSRVAGERIRDELMATLVADRAFPSLTEMGRAGVLSAIFPELNPMKGQEQKPYHHLDVWDHTLETVNRIEEIMDSGEFLFGKYWPNVQERLSDELVRDRPRIALLKLAALFHDAGKPHTVSFDPDGRVRFFDHEKVSREIFESAVFRLKLARRESRMIADWVEGHMRPMFLTSGSITSRSVRRLYRKFEQDTIGLLVLFLADLRATQGPARRPDEDQTALEAVKKALQICIDAGHTPPQPLLRGRDLIELFGLTPGPPFGRILKRIAELQDAGEITSREEAIQAAQELYEKGERGDGWT